MSSKKTVSIPSAFLTIGILVGWWILSFFAVKFYKSHDKEQFISKLDSLFHGRQSVSDWQESPIIGEFHPVEVESQFPEELIPPGENIKNSLRIRAGSALIMDEPEKPVEDDSGLFDWAMGEYKRKLAQWNSFKRLVDFYEWEEGGFVVYKVRKRNSGYDVVEYDSRDMAYKIAKSVWIAGTSYGYGNFSQGFYQSTNRPNINQVYDDAMTFLTLDEHRNESYKKATLKEIKSFPQLSSEFYLLQKSDPKSGGDDLPMLAQWKSDGKSFIDNPLWVLWYVEKGIHYEIIEKSSAFGLKWALFGGIGTIIIIAIVTIKWIRRKYSFRLS